MTLPKFLMAIAAFIFISIGIAAAVKKTKKGAVKAQVKVAPAVPIEITPPKEASAKTAKPVQKSVAPKAVESSSSVSVLANDKPLPHADRIEELFNKNGPKLPFVGTITYKSRVAWQKGRPAWLSDYATYYSTSRHFISRSLTGKRDYFKKEIAEGDRFNVLRKDKDIQFYLLIDTSRCRLWFYAIDMYANQRMLLKDYTVGLGRKDSSSPSGLLTPLGKYKLGSRIAIYRPKMTGYHKGQKVEMLQVFGTRWIPFDKEISDTTAPAKGFGLHGVPWKTNEKGELVEDLSSLGHFLSDGCIRLSTKDIEELFSIIITKPAIIELVSNFYDAKLPGKEQSL